MESENSRSTEFEKRRLYGALSLFLWATSAAAGPVSGVVQTTVRAGTTATQAVVFAEPLDRPATGATLLCCTRPAGPVALDL